MRRIFQTSCSELLVDTGIDDVAEAYSTLTELFELVRWESSPPLSIELLEQLRLGWDEDGNLLYPEVVVYDRSGNRAWLQYGHNGYTTTGYRFDSQCNDWDSYCFPIFREAINSLAGKLEACDGGHLWGYNEWEGQQQD